MQYYVPSEQLTLQPIQHSQAKSGVHNIKVSNMKHMTWPVSKPTKHQQRIHVSLNRDWGNHLSSQTTLSDLSYQQRSSLVDVPRLHVNNLMHQHITQPSSLNDDILYSCNYIAQLQGNYEIETSEGRVQVSVIMAKVSDQEKQYAVVHRVSNNGNSLADKFIHSELSGFNLCSADGNVEGVFMKGSSMKHSVNWWNAITESWTIWRRKGNVKFNLVQVEPSSRRNSLSSVCTVSTSPIVPYSKDKPIAGSDENHMRIRPELLQQRTPVRTPVRRPAFLDTPSSKSYSATKSLQSSSNNMSISALGVNSTQHDEMYEMIKAQCLKNPMLLKMVVDWGIRNNPARRVSQEDTNSFAEGRLWITAFTVDGGEGKVPKDSLDDIKGAYQEISAGIWKQPDPKACGSEVQHRLSKDEHGYWMLEKQSLEGEKWQVRAQQVDGKEWVDLQHNEMQIHVKIVPLRRILERLSEDFFISKNEVKKSIDFLFTSCNQVKLSKLKGRNLKHHIANLKVKLEKRYALSFGVQIANAAESIVNE